MKKYTTRKILNLFDVASHSRTEDVCRQKEDFFISLKTPIKLLARSRLLVYRHFDFMAFAFLSRRAKRLDCRFSEDKLNVN
jgi:hypothetical protein